MKIDRHTGEGRYPVSYPWIPDRVRNDRWHFHASLCLTGMGVTQKTVLLAKVLFDVTVTEKYWLLTHKTILDYAPTVKKECLINS